MTDSQNALLGYFAKVVQTPKVRAAETPSDYVAKLYECLNEDLKVALKVVLQSAHHLGKERLSFQINNVLKQKLEPLAAHAVDEGFRMISDFLGLNGAKRS